MLTEAATTLDRTWIIDPGRSTVGFTIAHFKVATVRGRFGAFSGTLAADAEGALRARGIVHAGTLDTGNALRDKHLRGAKYLDTDRHPEIRFASRRVERLAGELRITADLTIKGTTREIELRARVRAATGDRLELDVTGKLSRADFGIDAFELSAADVSDVVRFTATLSMRRDAVAPPGTRATLGVPSRRASM